ncbi:Myosin-IIIa [Amphibalanus amphitrite]|uniref:Myosin-IIIa n=1 Tax=Amphibalanus amphitrite TaxID=1232801 RepID=A0A6A4XF42_AMPAM|nr:Myosin-IIIa [Amphibalanus amphitrite]
MGKQSLAVLDGACRTPVPGWPAALRPVTCYRYDLEPVSGDPVIHTGPGSPGQAYSGLSQHVDFTALPEPGDRFLLETVVGEGTYGEVHAARDLHRNGQYVAIKILEDITDNIEEIEEEFLVLRDLCRHPNITQFHGMFFKPGKSRDHDQLWFVMEALVHLHQNHCMHRDVKGHNILLTGEGNVKVVDFGVSSHLAATLGRRNTSVGTPYWMAPEVRGSRGMVLE